MILQLRLDERLVHGQVVTAWSRALDVETIVCASDDVVQDSLRVKLLMMTAPPGKRVHVKSVSETIKLLSDPRADKMKILLITDQPRFATRLVESLKIQDVNIANFHSKDDGRYRVNIHEACLANKEDYMAYEELSKVAPNIFVQLMPTEEKRDFKALLSRAKSIFEN